MAKRKTFAAQQRMRIISQLAKSMALLLIPPPVWGWDI